MTIPFEPESARVNAFSTPWKVGNVLGTFQSFLKSMPCGGIPSNAETLSVFSSRLEIVFECNFGIWYQLSISYNIHYDYFVKSIAHKFFIDLHLHRYLLVILQSLLLLELLYNLQVHRL